MTKREQIEEEAIIIVDGIAFRIECLNNKWYVVCHNMGNISKMLYLNLLQDGRMYNDFCNMSEANMYKSMLWIERNKAMFLKEIQKRS